MIKNVFIFLLLGIGFTFVACFDTKSTVKDTVSTTIAEQQDRTLDTISVEAANTLIKEMTNLTILDVRTSGEYQDGHINGAINIDYYSDTFQEELAKYDLNKPYLIYCRSGSRSGKTLTIMADLGFNEVYNMDGGFIEWQSKGLPVVK